MKWPIVRLEQLAAQESGSIKIGPFGSQLKKTELVASGIHVVGIENVISNIFDELGDRYITEEKFSVLRSFEVKPDDVLMTMMGTVGEVGVVPQGTSTSIMDSHLLRFRPNPNLCTSEYVAWLLKGSASTRSALHGRAHGAIMKGLNSGIVRSLPAPLPPLSEQRRIVEILDQADALRKKCAEADAKAERILPALFYKMFGDPTINPKGWDIYRVADSALVRRGDFRHRPRTEPRFYGGPYPFIQINDITSSKVMIRKYTQTLNKDGLAISRMFPSGTVVLSIAATIAASGILGFDSCFPDSLVGVQGKSGKTTQEFLLFFFRLIAPKLAAQAPQLAQKNINLRILNDLEIPVPPIEYQQLFSQLVSRVVSISEGNEASRSKLTLLWDILLNRAFSGDLTAKWREAYMKELLAEMEQQARYLAPQGMHSQRANDALQESIFCTEALE